MHNVKNIDAFAHTRGESVYLDDIPEVTGTLYAACFDSPVAHGDLVGIDTSLAMGSPGVVRILTHADITGENQIGGIIPDDDMKKLNDLGIGKLFSPGTPTSEIADYIKNWVKENRDF